MNTAAPGWYPDPQEPRFHRWWDGSQWTEHTNRPTPQATAPAVPQDEDHDSASASASAAEDAVAPRKSRKVLFSVVGGVAAAALVVGGIVVVNALNGGAQSGYVEANGYSWAPIEYLDVDEDFIIPFDVDPEAISKELGNEWSGTHGVIDVYVDKAFQVSPATSLVLWWEDDREAVIQSRDAKAYPWSSESARVIENTYLGAGEVEVSDDADGFTYWTEMDQYYVVQRYDRSGEKLDSPIVHTISSSQEDGLEPIELNTSMSDETPGVVELSWEKPEGMPEGSTYYIMKTVTDSFGSDDDINAASASFEAIAETTETSWQSTPSEETEGGYLVNRELQLFGLDSADDANYSGRSFDNASARLANLSIVAIAPDKSVHTPMVIEPADSQIGHFPLQKAFWQSRDLFPVDAGDLTGLPIWYPVTTLNGNTQKMPIRIDTSTIEVKYEPYWYLDGSGATYARFPFSVLGTTLTGRITAVMPAGMSEADWLNASVANAEAYNTRAAQEAPKLGDRVITADASMSMAAYRKMEPVSEVPDSEHEVYGSNDFTTFIAGHMLGGTESIDISRFTESAAYPDVNDAAIEAISQNPLVKMSVDTFRADRDRLYVAYNERTTDDVRDQVEDIADAAVAEAVTDGMSDAEKVTAVNQWIVDHMDYDYAALEKLDAGLGFSRPGEDMRVSDARGGLIDRMVICGGYADTFNLLIRKAGLESVYVSGTVLDSNAAHAWNHVKVDGEWKAVDSTWNDGGDPREYLLINESQFTDHAARTLDSDGWIPAQYQDAYRTP